MSTLEVNTISPISGSSDVTLGGSSKNIKFASGTTVDFSTNTPTLSGLPGNSPAFAVVLDASQSLSNNVVTKLTFTSELIDTDSAFADSKFTVPSGKAGKYFFQAKVRAANVSTSLSLFIYKNGSEVNVGYRSTGYSAGGIPYGGVNLIAVLDLSEGDYVEIYGDQNSGSTNSVTTKLFQGFKLT